MSVWLVMDMIADGGARQGSLSHVTYWIDPLDVHSVSVSCVNLVSRQFSYQSGLYHIAVALSPCACLMPVPVELST